MLTTLAAISEGNFNVAVAADRTVRHLQTVMQYYAGDAQSLNAGMNVRCTCGVSNIDFNLQLPHRMLLVECEYTRSREERRNRPLICYPVKLLLSVSSKVNNNDF